MNYDELVKKINIRLDRLKLLAERRRLKTTSENQEKIDALMIKAENRITSALHKVKETVETLDQNEKEEFINSIDQKCNEILNNVKKTIIELQRTGAFKNDDHFFESEEIKNVTNTIKETCFKINQNINDYISKPETQENIRKAKRITIKYAEKGVKKLKDIFDIEEE